MKLSNTFVFITGAGSGIGRETAALLARRGCRLALTDINEVQLNETVSKLGHSVVFSHSLDVSNESDFRNCANLVCEKLGVPDVVINNAGVGLTGLFKDCSLSNWQWILDINFKGVLHGCHFFAPAMLERGSGHIVNIASGFGLFSAPRMSAYCATKHAVVGLSESLRSEFAESGVGVSVICPGVVNTAISRNMKVASGDQSAVRNKTAALYQRRNYTPDKVAARIVVAIEKNQGVVPVCPETHFSYVLKRISPSLSSFLLRILMKRTLN